jgi:hypothetical protein
MTSPGTPRLTITVVAALALLTLTGCVLTGCVGHPDAKPSSGHNVASARPSATATPSANSPTPTPTPTASAPSAAIAVSVNCSALISAQQMYEFNPNFGLDASFAPKSGTSAAKAVADKGVACNWTNQTSGDTVTFSVAKPGAAALGSLKSAASAGTAASGLGEAAWFSAAAGSGTLTVFKGEYWLTAVSVYFGAASDATDLTSDALAALT